MKKIFFVLLVLFGFAFFILNTEPVQAADGACICDEVSFQFVSDKPLIPNLGPFVYNNVLVTDAPVKYLCDENLIVTTTWTIYDRVKTHKDCKFKEDFCLCDVESPNGDMNNTKLELPPEAQLEGVDKTNCAGTVYVETLGDKPLTCSSCVWYEAAEDVDAALPPATNPKTTGGAATMPEPPPASGVAGTVTLPGSKEDGKASGKKAGSGATFVKLDNPLGTTDIRILLGKIVSKGMSILGSVTLLVFVYGGFLWLTSAGSAEKVKKGSQTMMWAVIGLFLIFGSYAILGLVLEGIGAREQGSSGPTTGLNIP
ncbi:MAG: hypothetical protein HOA57_01815 [Candidatus Magasanikbacteria bacterium]|nr:hypothetical protein [Candidatus Magasanikbacteria bacterium]